MATDITAHDYLANSEFKLRAFKREWEAFTKEIPGKMANLIASSITYNFNTSGDTSTHTITARATLRSNTDPAKEYVNQIQTTVDKKLHEIEACVEELDANMQDFITQGIDGDLFKKLVKHLNDWIAYIPQMEFCILGQKVILEASDNVIAIKNKWAQISSDELQKIEARANGVDPADLEKHKKYMEAKSLKLNATTSIAMQQAEKSFSALKGYLDSADLAKACASAAAVLKVKEDRRARVLKEYNERKKQEEEKRLQMEKAAYEMKIVAYEAQVVEVTKARERFLVAEADRLAKNHKNTMAALQSQYNKASKKNKKATEAATAEKNKLEQELAAAGLFAFAVKKQLRTNIKTVTEKLRLLHVEQKELDANYKVETTKQTNAYEANVKAIPTNAEKTHPMPADPRKK